MKIDRMASWRKARAQREREREILRARNVMGSSAERVAGHPSTRSSERAAAEGRGSPLSLISGLDNDSAGLALSSSTTEESRRRRADALPPAIQTVVLTHSHCVWQVIPAAADPASVFGPDLPAASYVLRGRGREKEDEHQVSGGVRDRDEASRQVRRRRGDGRTIPRRIGRRRGADEEERNHGADRAAGRSDEERNK